MINRTPMGEQQRALRGIIIRAPKHACVSEIGPLFATGDSQVFAVSAVGRKVGTQVSWISSRDRIVLRWLPWLRQVPFRAEASRVRFPLAHCGETAAVLADIEVLDGSRDQQG